jgi:predicted porin
MRPRILLLAASAVACASAQAASVVEMYGSVMPMIDSVETTGASPAPAAADRPNQVAAATYTALNDPRRQRVTVGSSNWGFRGYEDLGPDLRLVWQLESGFQLDQNTGPGIGARDSKVGFKNRLGEIFIGQWDTPFKYISLPVNPLRVAYTDDRSIITGNPGFNVPNTTTQFGRVPGKPDASFDRRVGNSIQYWSPNLGGFSFRLDHGVNETRGPVVAGGPVTSPTVNGASLQFDAGGLSLRYGYEQHNDYFGMTQIGGAAAGATNSSSKDQGHKFVILWRIGNTRITGLVEQLKYKNNDSVAGNVDGYKRTAYYGVFEQRFGAGGSNSIWISYGRAADGSCTRVGGAACSTHALGADYLTLGYLYRFSKRTEGFITLYRLQNKENAQYSVSPVVAASGLIAPGADAKGAGAGIFHTF